MTLDLAIVSYVWHQNHKKQKDRKSRLDYIIKRVKTTRYLKIITWWDLNAGKDWRWEEKGIKEDKMVGWHHWLDGHRFGWTPGVGDGQGGLACCGSWGHKESDMTERLNWIELNYKVSEVRQRRIKETFTYLWLWEDPEIGPSLLCLTKNKLIEDITYKYVKLLYICI